MKKDKSINGKSFRQIANDLGLNISTISQTLNGCYEGKEETKQKILMYVEMLRKNKVDFNLDIYSNLQLLEKVFFNALKDRKYNSDETKILISVYDKIQNINMSNENPEN